jgi:glutathione S-transferase
MLTLHHLADSRSKATLWLLEELGRPYEIVRYERDPVTRLAPPGLEAVHSLGKSPVVTDGDEVLIESGAIVETLVRRYGGGQLAPESGMPAYDKYVEWLHFAEGSAMLPLMLKLYVSRLGEAGSPLHPRIESEIARNLGYINHSLIGREWLLGDFSAADIQLSFVGEITRAWDLSRGNYAALDSWVSRFSTRPAYVRAVEKGGPYTF